MTRRRLTWAEVIILAVLLTFCVPILTVAYVPRVWWPVLNLPAAHVAGLLLFHKWASTR